MNLPTLARLKEVLHYDLDTGVWTWLVWRGIRKAGEVAGTLDEDKYTVIGLDGELYYAHCLAWYYVTGEWPKNEVDHKNHTHRDNSWKNLREVTHQENGRNLSMPRTNTSGFVNIHPYESTTKGTRYVVRMYVNKKLRHIGTYDTQKKALTARDKAHKKYGYHPNHGK